MPTNRATTPSAAVSEIEHAWTRFWRVGNREAIGAQQEAYLIDRDRFLGQHAAISLWTLAEISNAYSGCLVLSGDPGMGKTRTLDRWLRMQTPTDTAMLIHVAFRSVPDRATFDSLTISSHGWHWWLAGFPAVKRQMTLVVDGIDEGVVKVPGFVEYLTERLKDAPLDRLRVILVCRSLDWPESEGARLMALWPNSSKVGKFELERLRMVDVENAATDYGLDRGGFLQAVRKDGLDALAARPLTLRMLLLEFMRHRRFSQSRSELIRRHLRSICQEIDQGRARRLKYLSRAQSKYTATDRYDCATWIAGMAVLGGKSAVRLGAASETGKSELRVDELTQGWRKSDGAIPSPELLRGTIETPVFASRGESSAVFQHQVFAEILAASLLARRPLAQQVKLLSNQDGMGSYVEPPLAEVAAWLSTESCPFRAYLLEHEPEVLLRADIAAFASAEKRQIVDRLIAGAKAGRIFDRWTERRYYQGLQYNGLSKQLRPYILDQSAGQNARRMALTIAAACHCHPLLSDVLACCTNAKDGDIHSAAAAALPALTQRRVAPRLAALAKRSNPALDRQVRFGCVIALLETKYWTLRDVVPYLSAVVNPRSTDTHLLAQYCSPRDIPFILGNAKVWPGAFEVGGLHYGIVRAGFISALPKWNIPTIRRGLANLWIGAAVLNGLPDDLRRALQERGKRDPRGRHAWIESIAGLRRLRGMEQHYFVTLFGSADLGWLVQRVRTLSRTAQQNIAVAIDAVYRSDYNPAFFGEILDARRYIPAMRKEFAWLRPWRLDEPIAVAAKRSYALQREAAAAHTQPSVAPQEVWQRDLRALQAGSKNAWVWASDNLFYKGKHEFQSVIESNLIRADGWRFHTAAAHKTFRQAARKYLLENDGDPHFEIGHLDAWGIAGYRAIVLLKGAIQRDRDLRKVVIDHWIPTILNWFGNSNAPALKLVRFAYQLDSLRVLAFIEQELAREAVSEQGLVLSVRKYRTCWDRKVSARVLDWVLRYPQLRARVLASLTRELIIIHEQTAWRLCLKIYRCPKFDVERKAAVLGAWLESRIWRSWRQAKPMLRDETLARAAFLEASEHHQIASKKAPKLISAVALEEVYLLLRQLFPLEEDEPIPTNVYTPSRRMEVAQWRNSLPQILAAQANLSACRSLARLAAQSSANEQTWIQMRLQEAIQGKRRRNWVPVSPNQLRSDLARI